MSMKNQGKAMANNLCQRAKKTVMMKNKNIVALYVNSNLTVTLLAVISGSFDCFLYV